MNPAQTISSTLAKDGMAVAPASWSAAVLRRFSRAGWKAAEDRRTPKPRGFSDAAINMGGANESQGDSGPKPRVGPQRGTTLGHRPPFSPNPNGVVANGRTGRTQSRWDCQDLVRLAHPSKLKACHHPAQGKAAGRHPGLKEQWVATLKGLHQILAPLQGAANMVGDYPGYRFAQPWAKCWQPFRLQPTAHGLRVERN